MNWKTLIPALSTDLNLFVSRKLSAENLYKVAVSRGVGPELRPLIRSGADRGRRIAREALRRRNLLSV